jgi:long-chain acyl-CoA synthetase
MITHKNMVAALAGYNTVFEVNDSDVYLNYLPLAHVLALVVSNGILHKGLPVGIGVSSTWLINDRS